LDNDWNEYKGDAEGHAAFRPKGEVEELEKGGSII
jgi:hypothetical protein